MDHQEEFEALERVLTDPSADPIPLSHEFLENITEGFIHVIGSGGFGVVYMGFVKDVKIAVKKLFRTGDFSDVQFGDELRCLQRVKHKNIVRCLGYCSDTEKVPVEYKGKLVMAEERRRYLCFEYVPNLSLHEFLKDESCRREWGTRYQLIVGICQGLQYLHNEERINHLDLKPANILLDADMVPKITDFGLSRRFSGAQSRKITENIRGSLGYIAPEYWNKGEISFKTDIFSLGVIIKNILKGSTDLSDFENWYKSLDLGPQLKRCIEIAQLCVDNDQHKRPAIDSVVAMLNGKENSVQMVYPVSDQSRKRSSSLQQASISMSKMVDEMQSMAVSAAAFHSQMLPITIGNDEAISSISKSADGLQLLPISAGPLSKQQQHEQINSVLRGPGEQSTESNNFDHNLLDEAQSMSDLGSPSLVQQNVQITSIPKGPGETSSTGASSVSKLMDNNMHKVVSTEPSSSHHQQLERFISVIKGPAKEITEVNSFVHDLLDEAQSISALGTPSSHRVTSVVRNGPGETCTETSNLLDVYPPELCFPFERNKLIRCPVTVTNKTEHYVGVWITLTYPDIQTGLCFPVTWGEESLKDTTFSYFFELMGPYSSLAVPMTMEKLRVPPSCDTGNFEVLMIVMRQKEHLEKLKASNMDDYLLKRAELGGMVHRVILKASIQYQISCQAVITNYKFMPTRTSFRDIKLITDVHPAKTWLLACQKGGRVSIWDYEKQERLKFIQVTKVRTTERRPSRETPELFPPNHRSAQPFPLVPNEEADPSLVRGERQSRAPPPRLSLPMDLYPEQEVGSAMGGSGRVEWRTTNDRGGIASKLDGVVDVVQLGHGQEGARVPMTMESDRSHRRSVALAPEGGTSVEVAATQLGYEQGRHQVLAAMQTGRSQGGGVGMAQPAGYGGQRVHQVVTTIGSGTSQGSRGGIVASERGRIEVAVEGQQGYSYVRGFHTLADIESGRSSHARAVPSPSRWGGRVEMVQLPRGGYRNGMSQVPTTMGHWQRWNRGVASPGWLFPEDRVEVAAGWPEYWHRGEGRRPRNGRYDEATRRRFIGPAARGSWGGARRQAPMTSHPQHASSSHPRTSIPTTNDSCLLDVRSAKFIAREQWLAIGDDDGCVHIYDYSTAVVVKVTEFTAHDGGIVDLLSVHPTRQLLLTAYSFVGTVKLWDWGQEWKCIGTFNVLDTRLLHLSWDPSDTNVFATLSNCNKIKLWKTDSSDPSATIEGMNRADYLCSGSQRHLMVTTSHLDTNDKKSAMIWDLQTRKHVYRLGLSGYDIYDIACHPSLPILATSHSHSDGSIVCLWNTRNYRLETILQLPESHSPGLIFVTSTEDVTRLVTQCRGGISTVEIKMPTSY